MKTAKLNYFIDLLMTISFLITTISGLVLFFFLPGGQKRGGYQEFLGIVRHDWVNLHNWSGFFFIFFGILHLVLHLQWILEMTKNIFKKFSKNSS